MSYDSTIDTLKHIKRVQELLSQAAIELLDRGVLHDESKLEEEEKLLFDYYTPKLKDTTYGSEEYYEHLEGLKPALEHHYQNNRHHPEFFENGIDGMDLFDVLEMFMDWKAASERHEDGDLEKSIEHNKKRFGMSEQLCNILRNTVSYVGK